MLFRSDRFIVLTKERRKKKVSRFIPLSIPNFEGNERKYVDDAIDQGLSLIHI